MPRKQGNGWHFSELQKVSGLTKRECFTLSTDVYFVDHTYKEGVHGNILSSSDALPTCFLCVSLLVQPWVGEVSTCSSCSAAYSSYKRLQTTRLPAHLVHRARRFFNSKHLSKRSLVMLDSGFPQLSIFSCQNSLYSFGSEHLRDSYS